MYTRHGITSFEYYSERTEKIKQVMFAKQVSDCFIQYSNTTDEHAPLNTIEFTITALYYFVICFISSASSSNCGPPQKKKICIYLLYARWTYHFGLSWPTRSILPVSCTEQSNYSKYIHNYYMRDARVVVI